MKLSYIKGKSTLYRELTIRKDLVLKSFVKLEDVSIPQAGTILNYQLRCKIRLRHQAGEIDDKEKKEALKLLK